VSDPQRTPGAPEERVPFADGTDSNRERELRAVVSLLRGLAEPEPPEQLVERVMARVRAREARPNVIRVAFRRVSQPAVASALAAGIGCLLLVGALQQGVLPGVDAVITVALPSLSGPVADDSTPRSRRPAPVLPSSATATGPVAFFAGPRAPLVGGLDPAPRTSALDRGLDHQLNLMLLDPDAFFRRLDRVTERDRYLARLAERAAQRGDSAEVALRLRATRHPMAEPVVDRLLNASLAEYIGR
jgi:hypothetical protein